MVRMGTANEKKNVAEKYRHEDLLPIFQVTWVDGRGSTRAYWLDKASQSGVVRIAARWFLVARGESDSAVIRRGL